VELDEIVAILEAIKETAASRRINNERYRTIGAGIDAILADINDNISYEYDGDLETALEAGDEPPVPTSEEEEIGTIAAQELGLPTSIALALDGDTDEIITQEDDSARSQEAE